MSLRFVVPRSLHLPAAPLGRLVRRRAADARRAESLYYVAAALVLTAGTLLGQWGWIAFGICAAGGATLATWVAHARGWPFVAACVVGAHAASLGAAWWQRRARRSAVTTGG